MSPIANISGGIFLIVVGVVATILVSAFTPIAMLFYGAVIVGLLMIAWDVFQLIIRGTLNMFPQLSKCRIGTDDAGNPLPSVLIPARNADRALETRGVPLELLHSTDRLQILTDVIYKDLNGEYPYPPYPWNIENWLDVSVLRGDNGKVSHLCVLLDDGAIQQETSLAN